MDRKAVYVEKGWKSCGDMNPIPSNIYTAPRPCVPFFPNTRVYLQQHQPKPDMYKETSERSNNKTPSLMLCRLRNEGIWFSVASTSLRFSV